MEVATVAEVSRLTRENEILRDKLAQSEHDEERVRDFASRQTQRLVNLGQWEPGQDEPLDDVMEFALGLGEVREVYEE